MLEKSVQIKQHHQPPQQDIVLTTGHDGRVLALSTVDAAVCTLFNHFAKKPPLERMIA